MYYRYMYPLLYRVRYRYSKQHQDPTSTVYTVESLEGIFNSVHVTPGGNMAVRIESLYLTIGS